LIEFYQTLLLHFHFDDFDFDGFVELSHLPKESQVLAGLLVSQLAPETLPEPWKTKKDLRLLSPALMQPLVSP